MHSKFNAYNTDAHSTHTTHYTHNTTHTHTHTHTHQAHTHTHTHTHTKHTHTPSTHTHQAHKHTHEYHITRSQNQSAKAYNALNNYKSHTATAVLPTILPSALRLRALRLGHARKTTALLAWESLFSSSANGLAESARCRYPLLTLAVASDCITGGSWHKYHFCSNKGFVATKVCLPR